MIYVLGYFFKELSLIADILLTVILIAAVLDIIFLFRKSQITAHRITPERLSNGDDNYLTLRIINNYNTNILLEIVDEIPYQFQKRDFKIIDRISANSQKQIDYILRPIERGSYQFGNLNIYTSTVIGFCKRKYIFSGGAEVQVYPSFLHLKHYEMIAVSNKSYSYGFNEVSKLGNSMEFEHIRDYRIGDDYRTINWKATARRNDLMVNQYIDERSQNIYSFIDMGRVMRMPFNGLSLLDYAINTSLAMSSIILKRYDKAGLLTFAKDVKSFLPAINQPQQLPKIMEMLYNSETNFEESSFEYLYTFVRRKIPQRSLLMIYTNFETIDSMRRNLDYIRLIAKFHLPLVIFFENTELSKLLDDIPQKSFDIYKKVTAEQYMIDKYEIINELRANGIIAMLSKPENLTLNSINKYLEIKSRRLV
ncbi:MAG: DUF58 domain-containing protein [Candidatus Kapabacteria bacterium]|nr:DUF58 domain-containing protein [Ignavibacteriota bacterium]MCW5886107.1 DUF58 domain-containing protein [Candidatus Kapabacteria bacterium]